ncbi:MAG: hypothetical protein GY928_14655 [Colwellia sp.]|nr:hypothetical protein [Colwellia sp.]
MNTSQNKKIDFYKSLDFVKVWNYYKVEETGDFRYLLKLDDYDTLPDFKCDELESVYSDLKLEVAQVAIDKDRKSEIVFDKQRKCQELKNQYDIIQLIINCLLLDKDDKYIKLLSDYGYKINESKDYYEELERITKASGSIITKIGRLEYDINDLTKVGAKSSNKTTIWDELESIGSYLKEDIDPFKMSMTMYLIKKYKVLNSTRKDEK